MMTSIDDDGAAVVADAALKRERSPLIRWHLDAYRLVQRKLFVDPELGKDHRARACLVRSSLEFELYGGPRSDGDRGGREPTVTDLDGYDA
jgi:hypothetical protein